MDSFTVPNGLGYRLHSRAALAKGLHHSQPTGVLQHRASHVLVGLRFYRGVHPTVVGNEEQTAKGQRRRSQRDQCRQGTAQGQAEEDDQKVQVSAHKVVDHPDAHAFQGG